MLRVLTIAAMLSMSVLPSFAQEPIGEDTIGLDKLIRAVVNDIRNASSKTEAENSQASRETVFSLGETELELKFTIEKSASGKVEARFWSVGAAAEGSASSQNIQTVRIKLLPSVDDSGKPITEFSHFKPGDSALLLDADTYTDLKNAAAVHGIELAPVGVNAAALGVATDGVVVSTETYNKVLQTLKKADPGQNFEMLEQGAVPVTVPSLEERMIPQLSLPPER